MQETEKTAAKIIKLMSQALAQMSQAAVEKTRTHVRIKKPKKGQEDQAHVRAKMTHKDAPGRDSMNQISSSSSSHSLLKALNNRLRKTSVERVRSPEVPSMRALAAKHP